MIYFFLCIKVFFFWQGNIKSFIIQQLSCTLFYCFFPHIVLWWKSLRSLLVRSKLWNSSFCNEHLRLKRAWLTNGEFKWQLHYFKGAFTNYVDKILPIIDHLHWYKYFGGFLLVSKTFSGFSTLGVQNCFL